jgi:hypothetical protein
MTFAPEIALSCPSDTVPLNVAASAGACAPSGKTPIRDARDTNPVSKKLIFIGSRNRFPAMRRDLFFLNLTGLIRIYPDKHSHVNAKVSQ